MIEVKNIFRPTPVFAANMKAEEKVVVNQGGTWSGKTFGIIQTLLLQTIADSGTTTTIVGQDVPNLRKGAIKDFHSIIDEVIQSLPEEVKPRFNYQYNKSEKVCKFDNGSIIEFSSFKDWQDAKSGKRDRLFVNEANGIPFKVYEQLAIRTKKKIYIDYNPDAPFWVHHYLQGKENVKFIYSNFTHNPFVPEDLKKEFIQKGKDNPMWWKVYGLGKTGQTEGVVFPDVNWISRMPKDEECQRIAYGLDFGYVNDPTAMVKVALCRGELYVKLLFYKKGMLYNDIANHIKANGIDSTKYDIFCDNDQRAIDTIKQNVVYLKAAKKGSGSIVQGIQSIREYKLNIVDNIHFKAEQLGYKWKESKMTGEFGTEPIDKYNHAWDATRYAMQGIIEESNPYIFI